MYILLPVHALVTDYLETAIFITLLRCTTATVSIKSFIVDNLQGLCQANINEDCQESRPEAQGVEPQVQADVGYSPHGEARVARLGWSER